jgi:hypothetical protein
MSRVIAVLILVLFAAGCEARSEVEEVKAMISRGEPVPAIMRVENGVTIYEHAPDAFSKAPQWTLEGTPASTYGGDAGDPQYDLTYAYFAVPLSDGRLMTFAPVGNKVFVFGRDGKGERVIGRTGQGSGDWMRFGDPVLLEDDTVLVLDFANRRLNWVTADGGIVRTAPYEISADMRGIHNISGFISTGELLMHSASSWGGHQTDSLQRSLARVARGTYATGSAFLGSIPISRAQVETGIVEGTKRLAATPSVGSASRARGIQVCIGHCVIAFNRTARRDWIAARPARRPGSASSGDELDARRADRAGAQSASGTGDGADGRPS